MRLRLGIRYDGSDLHGWARQTDLRTVQGELETALSTVLRQPVALTVAGRTDAGVHALGQVAHLDVAPMGTIHHDESGAPEAAIASLASEVTSSADVGAAIIEPLFPRALGDLSPTDLSRFRDRVNGLLAAAYSRRWRPLMDRGLLPRSLLVKGESDILVTDVAVVGDGFDARFSATGRTYRYTLVEEGATRDPLLRHGQWWAHATALDVDLMNEAASLIVGERDFLSFCRPRDGATTVRTLRRLDVVRRADGAIDIHVEADAFCHSMVRSLVGVLVDVGRGARDLDWVRTLVGHPSRRHGVPIAPPRGLTLMHVDYPPEDQWETRAKEARNRREAPPSPGCC